MKRMIDITGKRFGYLTAVKFVKYKNNKKSNPYWEFICDCGKTTFKSRASAMCGNTRSCGHLVGLHRKMKERDANGKSYYNSPTYSVWRNIKTRCNPKNEHLRTYLPVGYDKKWETFSGFIEDMGEKPKTKEIGRLDSSKGFSKDNCRWMTRKDWYRNVSRKIEFKGKEYTLAELSKKLKVSVMALINREKHGVKFNKRVNVARKLRIIQVDEEVVKAMGKVNGIKYMRNNGSTLEQAGRLFGVSRERARQIIRDN